MNSRHFAVFVYCFLLVQPFMAGAQRIDTLESRPGVSFRGLSVVNNRLLWVSGSKGTVGRSTNAGKSFQWFPVKGHETRDFRDIEAFDAVTAVIMAVDSPGLILRTHDGGATWQEVYKDTRSGIFLDAMDFWKDKQGMAIGDPVGGRTVLVTSNDEGQHWTAIPPEILPQPDSAEACFASSGTNIQLLSKKNYVFVTGGFRSRAYRYRGDHDQWVDLPLVQKGNSTGANSLAIKGSGRKKNPRHMVVVGGDFTRDTIRTGNAAITGDGGKTWKIPEEPPFGYRSSAVYIRGNRLIACGTSGVDISDDGGRHWCNISKLGFHVVQVAKDGRAVYLAGGKGRLAKLAW
ncbi:WD40/YVTN/BNR-like repeat-containing protein [Flavihumibacter fluvii]|uniref:WD40/YVTN/BNR-like repeat-containing protein n=1 Tax=Flavihumibacter fluvii TaxID=2838157 RepID=UPI001BDF4616|nr:oxidoreductase [Flavihumibacter fluvii]ULQ54107.1 oxidoreductase [Flavihumibacter fluvii]